MPRSLKLWSVLVSLCLIVTVLLANAFPLSWIVALPAGFSLLADAVLMYYLSLPAFRDLKNLSVVCLRLIRSRQHFEGALEGNTACLDLQLDGLEGELKQLGLVAAELDWKVKQIPDRTGSLRHAILLRQLASK